MSQSDGVEERSKIERREKREALENNPFLLDSMSNYLQYCAENVPYLRFVAPKPGPPEKKASGVGTGGTSFVARSSARLQKSSNEQGAHPAEPLEDLNLCALDKKCVVRNRSSDLEILLKHNVATPFELLRAKRKKGVNGMYEEVSELQLLEHIKQMMLVMRNLSYIRQNEHYTMKCPKFVDILIALFAGYVDCEITAYTLETICNIAKHILLADCRAVKEFLDTLMECLNATNPMICETALETFRRLSLSAGNEEHFENMPQPFIKYLVNALVSPNPEVREAALEILCPISDRKLAAKQRIAKEPKCIKRLVGLLYCARETPVEEKISKLAALTLANLSLAPAIKDQLMIYEQELVLVACSDNRLSEIVCNLLAELDSYQLTKPHCPV